jgi:hypothetical protein
VSLREDKIIPVIEARVNGGMVTSIDPADIEPNSLQDAKNAYVRLDKTGTIEGVTLLTPTKPNTNSVLALYTFKQNDGDTFTLRFTKSGVHRRTVSTWSALSGALTGSDTNLFNIVTAFNQCVFTNGVDDIKQIDSTVNTISDLGNAPSYKFITAFYNRIVGAHLKGGTPNPAQVGWSGDGAITEWDGLVNLSAGNTPLVESPGDFADYITGIYGFTNVMIVLREQSVWLATKQPIAANPFNFFASIPGKGNKAPYSTAVIPGGIVWTDPRTRKIYVYIPGSEPESIGEKIENQIFPAITDPDQVKGSYSTKEMEYSVLVPTGTEYTRIWRFNFRNKAWAYHELPFVNSVGDVEAITEEIMVDDLVGFVDDLAGMVDDLGATVASTQQRIYGKTDGDIYISSPTTTGTPTGSLEVRIVSKNYYLPIETAGVVKLKFEFIVFALSTINLYYSKDNGSSWTLAKTQMFLPQNETQLLIYHKYIRARKFTWKLECSMSNGEGKWELLDYEVHLIPSGKTEKDF